MADSQSRERTDVAPPDLREAQARWMSRACGAVVLIACVAIWHVARPAWFPPVERQINRPLLNTVSQLAAGLDGDSRVWILTQDDEPGDLPRRKIAYALIPHRTLYLPRNLRDPQEVPAEAVDPAGGSRGTLGDAIAFTDVEFFRRYLRNMGVTHILIAQGDPSTSTLTGIDLAEDTMYLLRFDRDTGQVTEVGRVARP
jgi:hypothetical protein